MRLFAGIRPSDDFRSALSLLQDRLRASGVTGRYLDPDNLHMTLAFIGEWPEDITPVLPPVGHCFSLVLAHVGFFPEANVLWAGVEASKALEHLAERTRRNLAGCGIPFDPKKFIPHITLVRKPHLPDGMILSKVEVPSVSMLVDEICLYLSERGENGMQYTVIGSTK